MSPSKIQETLISLGYKLSDRGVYWQTNAVFRNGDNQTALQIYKNTGVWKDYVQDTAFSPFKRLIEATLGTNDKSVVDKYINDEDAGLLYLKKTTAAPKIEMEEIYGDDMLERLLPHYKFYNNKGISTEILQELKGGLATSGQLNQRFVFPIFNDLNQIHGFSGRDMLANPSKSRPKWKHIGKKKNWIYPFYASDKTKEAISASRTVILVESIGDALNLKENSIDNCLVAFGLNLSGKLICHLVSLSLDQIVIAFNNDSDKADNRGLTAAVKSYLTLLQVFEADKIKICLPTKNDFGDMNKDDFAEWKAKAKNITNVDQKPNIINLISELAPQGKIPKKLLARKKLLEK
ncbi:MAG: hypothetical protein CMO74_14470 [Verrucomicrobiales bacterium]|nr:hypothetical protein [Verrucomicrobiales bacterium]|tara:strand:- start:58857 stop:59903 length:1047 start_codon:yes stop_codon:yes gene_type:complete